MLSVCFAGGVVAATAAFSSTVRFNSLDQLLARGYGRRVLERRIVEPAPIVRADGSICTEERKLASGSTTSSVGRQIYPTCVE